MATIADVPPGAITLLELVASANRRRVLLALSQGPTSVATLARAAGMPQACASVALARLALGDLVEFARHGNRKVYRLTPAGARAAGLLQSFRA